MLQGEASSTKSPMGSASPIWANKFVAHTAEGVQRNITAQVCEVTKALLSVRRLVENGHRVVFDPTGSYIEDCQTREKMRMEEKNGLYLMKVWTKTSGF